MYNSYLKEAEELEMNAKRLRQTAKQWQYAYENIHVGTLIQDLETNLIMKVDGLKCGCIDFSAKSINCPKSPGRGYIYESNNWKIITEIEIALNNSIDTIYNFINTFGAGRTCPPHCICGEKGCSKDSIKKSLYHNL